MYDIEPLEKEWKQYKLKKRRPVYYAIGFFLIIVFLLNIANLKNISQYIQTFYTAAIVENISNEDKFNSRVLLNHALTKIETNKMDEIVSVNSKSSDLLVDIPILDTANDTKNNVEVGSVRKKIFLDIVESSSVSAYADVEKRFAQSHDIDDAIFLAKSYYKKENYKKAAYWAYEVNKLNENMEESLFIFVKSKVKLGRVNEARSILNAYIKKSNSIEAKKVLSQIDNNRL